MPLCCFYALPNGFCPSHQNEQRAQSAAMPGANLRVIGTVSPGAPLVPDASPHVRHVRK